ncbi:MAG: dockerin type I repeat-containing protein [Acidobacteriota bacterium]
MRSRLSVLLLISSLVLMGTGSAAAQPECAELTDAPIVIEVSPSGPIEAGRVAVINGDRLTTGTVTLDGTPLTVIADRPDLGALAVAIGGTTGIDLPLVVTTVDGASNTVLVDVVAAVAGTCQLDVNVADDTFGFSEAAVVLVEDVETEGILAAGVTDAAGDVSFTNLPAGLDVLLIVFPDTVFGTAPAAFLERTCNAGAQAVNLTIERFNADFFTGSVSGDEDPVEGVLVEISGEAGDFSSVTDASGNFDIAAPAGNYDFELRLPFGSPFVDDVHSMPVTIDPGGTNLDIELDSGAVFCGQVTDGAGQPRAASLRGNTDFDGQAAGSTFARSSDGEFRIALPPGQLVNLFLEDLDDETIITDVRGVEIEGDAVAAFPFCLVGPDAVPEGLPPLRISFINSSPASIGEFVQINVIDLVDEIEVVFTAAAGGEVTVTDPIVDSARGVVAFRVPAGAGSGPFFLRGVGDDDGLEGPEQIFQVSDEPAPETAYQVMGQAQADAGGPVADALVLLFAPPVLISPCDDEDSDELVDVAMTGVDGSFTLDHPGGDYSVLVLPPAAAGLAPTSTGGSEPDGATENVGSVSLPAGEQVVVVASAGGQPAPFVEINVETEGAFDFRHTDAAGRATFFLETGNYFFEAIPPRDSRILEGEGDFVVPEGGLAGTPLELQTGVLIKGQLVDEEGQPLPGIITEANTPETFSLLFERLTGPDGTFVGPVRPGQPWQLNVFPNDPALASFQLFDQPELETDLIMYPPFELPPAGFIEGTILRQETEDPLAIPLNVFPAGKGGLIDFTMGGVAFGNSCEVDGSFRIKVPAGELFLQANAFGAPGFRTDLLTLYNGDTPCDQLAEPVVVEPGMSTIVDLALPSAGQITGNAMDDFGNVVGLTVCAENDAFDCSFCAFTDDFGNYSITAPAGALEWRVRALGSLQGLGDLCWNLDGGTPDCDAFDAVAVNPGSSTDGISFDFTCGDDGDDDGDGVLNCYDRCPDDNPDDSDGDGSCDADDVCPGEDDFADRDLDEVPDCLDGCPDDGNKVEPGDCGCGVVESDPCPCLPGDLSEDDEISLVDWALGRREVFLAEDAAADEVGCGDLHPGEVGCEPAGEPARWCVTGDADFDADDLLIVREMLGGGLAIGCDPCLAEEDGPTPAELRVRGDIAPRETMGDGRVNISDVVLALQFSVELFVPTPEELLRGDANEDGRITIADVVDSLRASVGLVELEWPEREMLVANLGATTVVEYWLQTSGWPASAEISGFTADGCVDEATDGGGLELFDDMATILCATDDGSAGMLGEVATIFYRAPEEIRPDSLALESEALDAEAAPTAFNAVLTAD